MALNHYDNHTSAGFLLSVKEIPYDNRTLVDRHQCLVMSACHTVVVDLDRSDLNHSSCVSFGASCIGSASVSMHPEYL